MAATGTNGRVEAGTTLHHGRYSLEEALGKGATAVVWRATDTVLGVKRAVKILNLRAAGSQALRRRLLAEARAMAQLKHPNILKVFDIGFDGERDFVVMELADQGSLADWVDAYGPMPPDMALPYVVQVLSALQAAHSRGIVHRDVKPQNILLDDQGTALLADFGIALLAEDQLRTTRTGVAMGSLAFMAPEQRLDARSVTPAADVYAAGTTLYNLLTAANPVDLFAADASSGRWAGIPDDLVAVIRRAVSYAPADRYNDARHMAEALTALVDKAGDQPIPTPPGAPAMPGRDSDEVRSVRPPDRSLRPSKDALSTAITLMAEDVEGVVEPLDLPELPRVHGVTAVVELPVPEAPAPAPPSATQAPASRYAEVPHETVGWLDDGAERRRRLLPLLAALAVVLVMGSVAWLIGGPPNTGAAPAPGLVTAVAEAPGGAPEGATGASAPPQAEGQVPADEAAAEADPAAPPGAAEASRPAPLAGSPATTARGTGTPGDTEPQAATPATTEPGPEAAPSGAASSSAAASAMAGTWTGNVHVQQGKLVLRGSDGRLSGLLTTTHPATRVSRTVAVSGAYDPASRTLRIEEDLDPAEDPTAGRYEAQLSEDGRTLTGKYHALVGQRTAAIKLSKSSS